MAQAYSFDIVSEVNLQEIDNAVNQTLKEMRGRFDFKGSKCSVEFLKEEKKIRLIADDEMKLRNLQDILKTRVASRQISLKALEFTAAEKAFEGTLRQDVNLVDGIAQDKAKEIVRKIKESGIKVQPSIQGEQIRVSSKSKDDLQSVIQLMRNDPPEIALQFTNYR